MPLAAAAGNYVTPLLICVGVLVTLAALLALPAVRGATGPTEPRKRSALVAAVSAALVIPALAGGQATVHYIDGLNDFTDLPGLCASSVVGQDRIAQFIEGPPGPKQYSSSRRVSCTWQRTGGDDGDPSELEVELVKLENSRAATRRLQSSKDGAESDGKSVVALQLGDEGFRRSYDSYINSKNTLGVAIEVRIDNVVLTAEFEQAESLGAPDSATLHALATDLVRLVESEKPNR